MAWRPIETAPRDGTWFVACRRDDQESCEVGCFRPLMWPDYVPVEGGLYRKEEKSIHEWHGFNNMHRMTHWMPLPKIPK